MKFALVVLSMAVLTALTVHGIVRIVDHALTAQVESNARLTGF